MTNRKAPAGDADAALNAADRPSSLWRNRSFVRFLAGQFVTNAGDSLYAVAVVWLVFDLSGSTVLTGLANALLLLPYLLQFVAGPLVDRTPMRGILVGTQLVQAVVVLVVPVAALTDTLSLGLVLAVVPALAAAKLLVAPVPAALLPRIVASDRLERGNSALATVTLGLDVVFDAAGGLAIAAVGTTALFLVDSVSFALAGVLFAGVVVPSAGNEAADGNAADDDGEDEEDEEDDAAQLGDYLHDLRVGVDALRGSVFVPLLVRAAAFNLAVGVTLAVLPAFGATAGGPGVYGLLLGAMGVGRFAGSVAAPSLRGVGYGWVTATSRLSAGSLWLGAIHAPSSTVAVGLFGVGWAAAGVDGVLVSTLNQRVFPADLLGRVSTLKGTVSTGTLPMGSVVGGIVASHLGVGSTLTLASGLVALIGLSVLGRRTLRRLPPVADADAAAFGVETSGSVGGVSKEQSG
ncbi:MFS transporter [Halobaculum lipolyticum]|uniref:MFS transporter n=1 Tax=Halobaculum lipolyticum TaxID=3032001 RepID=A0ABD5W582_9EURY|nr:MFS transporter [Halobaculum sp. DT31]